MEAMLQGSNQKGTQNWAYHGEKSTDIRALVSEVSFDVQLYNWITTWKTQSTTFFAGKQRCEPKDTSMRKGKLT